jgi:hypothetical protein
MTRACATCAWWDANDAGDAGFCRRYAPRPTVGHLGSIASDWPVTEDTDWCGEYGPREGV